MHATVVTIYFMRHESPGIYDNFPVYFYLRFLYVLLFLPITVFALLLLFMKDVIVIRSSNVLLIARPS